MFVTRVFIKLSCHLPLSSPLLDFLVAPVVQKVDSAILWGNLCPVDSALLVSIILIHWIAIYLVDGPIQRFNNWGLVVRSLSYVKTCFSLTLLHYVLFKSFDCELFFCNRFDLSGNR